MAISAKPAAKPAAKATAAAKSTAKAAVPTRAKAALQPSEPFLRFHHSPELQAKTDAVLSGLEASPGQAGQGDLLADLVAELTAAGMNYYYLRALKGAQVGFVVEQSARLAMSGAVKLISSVSRKYIVRMDEEQLVSVAQHIRQLAR